MVLDDSRRVVVLAGGVGGAKLALGMAQQVAPENLAIIGNVADDFELYGLHISPDLDTVMYTLSGIVDKANGWGVAGDSTALLDALRRYGVSLPEIQALISARRLDYYEEERLRESER